MLGMKTYRDDYISACRARIEQNVKAYDELRLGAAAGVFEARFFNDQLLLLDYMFVHRLSGIEGKDGNPLNEVRALSNSLLLNGGKLQVEKLPGWPNSAVSGLRLAPDRSLLKITNGQRIELTRDRFLKLADAFFEEIEMRYSQGSQTAVRVAGKPS